MIVIIESIQKVNDINCGSFHDKCTDNISNGDLGQHRQLRTHKYKYQQHNLDEDNNNHVMNVNVIVKLKTTNAEERLSNDYIDHVSDVQQNQQEKLDNWICKRYGQKDSSQEFVPITYQRLGHIPNTTFCLNWIGKQQKFVYSWLPCISEVDLVTLMTEVIIFIFNNHNLLIYNKVIGLLNHQIGNG